MLSEDLLSSNYKHFPLETIPAQDLYSMQYIWKIDNSKKIIRDLYWILQNTEEWIDNCPTWKLYDKQENKYMTEKEVIKTPTPAYGYHLFTINNIHYMIYNE